VIAHRLATGRRFAGNGQEVHAQLLGQHNGRPGELTIGAGKTGYVAYLLDGLKGVDFYPAALLKHGQDFAGGHATTLPALRMPYGYPAFACGDARFLPLFMSIAEVFGYRLHDGADMTMLTEPAVCGLDVAGSGRGLVRP